MLQSKVTFSSVHRDKANMCKARHLSKPDHFEAPWIQLAQLLNSIATIKLVKRRRMHNNARVDVEISSKHLEVHKPAFGWDMLVKESGLHNAKSLVSHQVLPEESQPLQKLQLTFCFAGALSALPRPRFLMVQ